MHATALRTLRRTSISRARFIANRGYPQRVRHFHSTHLLRGLPSDPSDPAYDHNARDSRGEPALSAEDNTSFPEVAEGEETPAALEERLQKARKDAQSYGSGLKRATRNRRPKEIPPITIPDWFLQRNVRLQEDYRRGNATPSVRCSIVIKAKKSNATLATIPFFLPAAELLDFFDAQSAYHGTRVLTPEQREKFAALKQEATGGGSNPTPQPEKENDPSSKGHTGDAELHFWIKAEIKAGVTASLAIVQSEANASFPAAKSNLILHCPLNGGIKLLDKLVDTIASEVGADVIQLEAQDFAEIGGEYIGENGEPLARPLRTLSYDTYRQAIEPEEEEEDVDMVGEADDDAYAPAEYVPRISSRSRNPKFDPRKRGTFLGAIPLAHLQGSISDIFKSLGPPLGGASIISNAQPNSRGRSMGDFLTIGKPQSPSAVQWDDMKLNALLEALLDTNDMKRNPSGVQSEQPADEVHPNSQASAQSVTAGPASGAHSGVEEIDFSHLLSDGLDSKISTTLRVDTTAPTQEATEVTAKQGKTVVLIRDYKELNATAYGGSILMKLVDIVHKRRKEGEQIMIVGTTSSADLVPELTKSAVKGLQAENEESYMRTIFVPLGQVRSSPKAEALEPAEEEAHDIWAQGDRERTEEINLRNIRDMIKRLDPSAAEIMNAERPLQLPFHPRDVDILRTRILTFDKIHRIALTAIGLRLANTESTRLEPTHIILAMTLLRYSDDIKFAWVNYERQIQKDAKELVRLSQSTNTPTSEARLETLRQECSRHEKRLLGGVINPNAIKTTFSDVHAPNTTIEALKTLTSLSLLRPEAFKYGVLATDKIPGLLLYGPPGTGKTLLAKAVAKESGATVLEVSGSEVNDMYVGEGEKNVKAIFTLARKLSPCVVFIDEADAIFGSRSGPDNRTSHREIINQFLKEWDGMNDLSVFIMVATNRPFDLDDAVLRRLPRRLLVDLPIEADRKSILAIHLKDETLADDVSLDDLAAQTPFYSGSDLKNLCVAAALACVKEENLEAVNAKTEGVSTYKYPEKRTLRKRHFDKALEEISASISEDMSSLTAIRKFDEQYGDRRGRRKTTGWGFGVAGEEVKEELARVRH